MNKNDNDDFDDINENFEPSKAEVVDRGSFLNNNQPKEGAEKKEKNDDVDKKKISDLFKSKPISYLNNVPLRITAELSRARITMRKLLEYKKGSIIQLEKLAGEPMDILINDEYMAKGEVVVVNDKYAVRLTDLIEKMEMLNREYNENITT